MDEKFFEIIGLKIIKKSIGNVHVVAMLERDAEFLHDKKANKKASLNYLSCILLSGKNGFVYSRDYFVMIV